MNNYPLIQLTFLNLILYLNILIFYLFICVLINLCNLIQIYLNMIKNNLYHFILLIGEKIKKNYE